MRGGYYSYSYGSLGGQSSNGYYWSRRLNHAANGYALYFYSDLVHPQYSNARGTGFTLRCLRARNSNVGSYPFLCVRFRRGGGRLFQTRGWRRRVAFGLRGLSKDSGFRLLELFLDQVLFRRLFQE